MFKFFQQHRQSYCTAYVVMLVAAIAAFIAAFTLSVEELEVAKNTHAALSCNINLVLNCGTVMKTWQAHVFGFPNPFLGVMGFAIVVAVAVGGLMRVKYSRIYLVTAQVFFGLGLLFAYWLFFQSLYSIQVLCPWCLVVTFTTTLIFESLLYINLRENNFGFKKMTNRNIQKFIDQGYDRLIVASWIVLLVALVIIKFGNGLLG